MEEGRRAHVAVLLSWAIGMIATSAAAGTGDPSSAAEPQPQADTGWHVSVAPYLWAMALTGEVEARGVTTDIDMSFSDILKELNIGAMGVLEVRRGRFLFLFDSVWASLSDDIEAGPRTVGVGPFSLERSLVIQRGRFTATPTARVQIPRVQTTVGPIEIDADITEVIVDTKLGWRALERPIAGLFGGPEPDDDPRRLIFDLLAGARYWYLKTELDVEMPPIQIPGFSIKPSVEFPRLGRTLDIGDVEIEGRVPFGGIDDTFEESVDWVDLIVGARVRADLTSRLYVTLMGDVGGFGIGSSSDFTWSAITLVGWKLSPAWTLVGGYKALEIDRGSADLTMHGLVMGAIYHFGAH